MHMKYNLDAQVFKFGFTAEQCEKECYVADSLMNIYIECDGFSAAAVLEMNRQDIVRFSMELYHLYRTLNGTAVIRELYNHDNFIEFSADALGHILVKGNLCNYSHCHKKELYFENEFDQTYLKDFAAKLYNEYVE